MMRVLALDIGEKRVGFAVSDPQEKLATPLCVLPTEQVETAGRDFARLLEDWEPDLLLCGLPLTLQGKEGPQARRVREVAASIAKATQLPLEFTDERLSSSEAKRSMRESGLDERAARGKIDMVAASIFLQAWLDQRNSASKDTNES